MIRRITAIAILLLLVSCSGEQEIVKPSVETITESIYASGVIKSEDQYQVFATVNGIVEKVFVEEGDTIVTGQPLFSLANAIQQLNNENASLTASFYDLSANQGKIDDAAQMIRLTRDKMRNDSLLYARQLSLWKQNVGTKVELEQRELAFENAQNSYQSAIVKYNDLKRQLAFNASQSKKNLLIAQKINDDYVVKSELNGIVYGVFKKRGELVNPQTPIAVLGDASKFVLEMQVDEYDITQIKKGQQVIVSMDSYQGKTFEARVTKINPMMNERTKSFTVEATFVKQPPVLFPNFSFEANIVLRSRKNALLIPRALLLPGNMVMLSNGEKRKVTTGLKDYRQVEITSGLKATDELIQPEE